MTGCSPRRAAVMNFAQTGAATAPPVRPRTGLVLSGWPTHTAAESTGVAPTNQASAPFSLVPVLPNGSQPSKAGDEPVMSVRRPRLVVDSVDDHEPSGSSLPGGNRLAEGFGKQERAVTLAL